MVKIYSSVPKKPNNDPECPTETTVKTKVQYFRGKILAKLRLKNKRVEMRFCFLNNFPIWEAA